MVGREGFTVASSLGARRSIHRRSGVALRGLTNRKVSIFFFQWKPGRSQVRRNRRDFFIDETPLNGPKASPKNITSCSCVFFSLQKVVIFGLFFFCVLEVCLLYILVRSALV
jgi:hypothetical protein